MVEIDDDFFENCRNRGQGFYPIKEWPKDNYRIVLSFQITVSGREQLFLNRIKNERRERGAEIPLNLAQEVGQWLYKQTSSNAYHKGECAQDNIGKLGDYTFELIKKFEINYEKTIALKLMHSPTDTKYFLNIEKESSDNPFQHGVEIPIDFVEQIGRYLEVIPSKI